MKIAVPLTIVFVAFIAATTLYLISSGIISLPVSNANAKTLTVSGLEIAKRSLSFFDEMRRQDGQYYYYLNCTDGSGCAKLDDTVMQANAWVALAYASMYKATGEQQYLQKMNAETDKMMQLCEGNEDSCMWILVQMMRVHDTSGHQEVLSFSRKIADRLISDGEERNAMLSGIESREFAQIYEATGDQKYLDEAKARLANSRSAWDASVDIYNDLVYSSGTFTFYRFSCWTELAELEIARVSNDNGARANAIGFLDSANLGSHWREIGQMTAIQPCIESLLNLYDQTHNDKYLSEAKSGMQYLVTYRWDPDIPTAQKYNGDGGYMFDIYNGVNDIKTPTESGYMIYLLSRIPNEQFEILPWR